MKIGILTYHSSKNFGSSLQCFALYSLIKQKKHKPVVIDYYSFNRKGIKNFIRRCIFFFEKLIKKSILNPQSQFLHFEYNLSKPYKTSDFILNEKLDKIIVGGDQLWNPAIIHNVYYGSFDTKNNYKKYSYAVSFGQSVVTLSNERIALLKNFTCLSVRENEGKNILDKYGLNSKVCLDPVLLHDSKFWKKNERKPYINDKRFIFCYFLKGIDSYSEDILEYSKRKNIKCVGYSLGDDKYIKRIKLGPREFLWMIHHAEKVVTNSYHCVLFSLIFHKEFVLYPRFNAEDRTNENTRFDQLNYYFDLSDKIPKSLFLDFAYDFNIFEEKLEPLRRDSIDYIDKIIND